MKRLTTLFALTALAAATVGLAQQATQQTQTQPPAAASQPDPGTTNQAPSPSAPGAGNANRQALMKDCITQVQAANPNVPAKDIQTYCTDQVQKMTSKPE